MASYLADYNPDELTKKKAQPGEQNIFDAVGAPPVNPAPTGGGMPNPTLPPPVDPRPTTGGMPNPVPPPAPAPSGARQETLNGMNGVRLANGDWVPADHPSAIAAMGSAGAVYPGGAPAPATATPAAAPAAPGTPAAGAPAGAPAPVPGGDLGSSYRGALMDLLNDKSTPSLSDPTIKAQSDAFAVTQDRAAERAREVAAEQAGLQGSAGVNSGAFLGDTTGILERAGENKAGFNAGLVGDVVKQKRDELLRAAALAGSSLDAESARAVQKEIAQLNAQIERERIASGEKTAASDLDLRRYGIDSQTKLGERDLSLRDKLGSGGLNAEILRILTQNDQFGKNLGANIGMFNQKSLMEMLGL